MGRKRKEVPPIGGTVYGVYEHWYHPIGQPRGRDLMEYRVFEGTIKRYLRGTRRTDMEVIFYKESGKDDGSRGELGLFYYPTSEIGKRVFLDPKGAALLAKEYTEKEERIRSIISRTTVTLRRSWEKYLEE